MVGANSYMYVKDVNIDRPCVMVIIDVDVSS